MKKELGCPFTMKEYEEVTNMKKCTGDCGCNGLCGDKCKCKSHDSAVNVNEVISLDRFTKDQIELLETYSRSYGFKLEDVTIEISGVMNNIFPVVIPNAMIRTPHGNVIETPIRLEDIK